MRCPRNKGFTIVELITVMTIIVIIVPLVFAFFSGSLTSFFRLQASSLLATDVASVVERMGQVIRSGTQITNAASNTLTVYAYFSPADATLSQVTYTYDVNAGTVQATVIPATGTPPNYTYNAANAVNYVLIRGVTLKNNLFGYEDSSGGTGPFDSTTYQNIMIVNIDLYASSRTLNATPIETKAAVLLRNRKAGS